MSAVLAGLLFLAIILAAFTAALALRWRRRAALAEARLHEANEALARARARPARRRSRGLDRGGGGEPR